MTVADTTKINILLVDDRPDGIYAMTAVLKNAEYNLVTANSGEEALRHFLRDDFAVVLLDVQMPGIDGFETARRMRRAQGTTKTPIIFVTAISVEDRYVYAGYETGAVDYVFKPFDPTILRSKVSVFVEMYKIQTELQRQTELLREAERQNRERMLAELELESLRRYQSLADAVPHVIWKAKPDGTNDYFNKVWFDYSGLTLDQSTGTGWHSAIHPNDLPVLLTTWDEARRREAPFETEIRLQRGSDGSYRWHLIRAVPEAGRSGEMTGWVGTSTDVHDRKVADVERVRLYELEKQARRDAERAVAQQHQAEIALIRAKEAAEDASRAKSQLLANMSHEIRTPLGVVLGFAELLLDPNQSEAERSEAIQTILRNGGQLAKLIDDILDISKVEAGRLDVEKIAFSMPDMMNDVITTMEIKARDKGLTLQVEVVPPVPLGIVSDPTRVRQILTNVVGNAIKFTIQGQVKIRVSSETLSTAPERARLKFEIADTGLGIPSAAQSRLFQDFMQADSSTTRRFGGTGLGLALSRRLARALGGDLVLETSESGVGSSFSLLLDVDVVDLHQRTPPRVTSTPKLLAMYRFEGVRVLLVDDAPDNQLLVSRILQRAGAEVTIASDGQEALDLTKSDAFDVILMDIQMPRMDGYEATAALRRRNYAGAIVALTAHAMKEERERCLATGFNDHLRKPIDYRELLGQIQKYSAQSRPLGSRKRPQPNSTEMTT